MSERNIEKGGFQFANIMIARDRLEKKAGGASKIATAS